MVADIQVGQHVLLDATNRGAGHVKLAAPAGGEPISGTLPTGACAGRTTSPFALKGLKEQMHRLPGDEGAAGKLGVGQTRSLGEQEPGRRSG